MHNKEINFYKVKDIIEHIRVSAHNKLNYDSLYELIEKNDIKIRFVEFRLHAIGLTTFDCIYINLNYLHRIDIIYYSVLHEIAHYLRMKKFGFEYYVENFLTNTFEKFFEYVINEEMIADRYACLVGSKLNKDNTCFVKFNQGLENKENQDKYREYIEDLHNSLPNAYEKYVNFIHENIVYVK